MIDIFNLYIYYLGLFLDAAWLWLPFALGFVFYQSWMYYIRRAYFKTLDWVTLEIKPPREIERTPKTMEQIFAGLWGAWGTISTKYEKYVKGVVQDFFVLELVSLNGEIHFYIRTLKKYRNLVEAQVYSQYPQAEVREAEDYIFTVPSLIPNKTWNLWGCRFKLDRDSVYPIRTYPNLVDLTKSDQPFLDPMASMMEVMGKLRPGENMWLQIYIRPAEDTWRDNARVFADKLLGKKTAAKAGFVKGWADDFVAVSKEIITAKPQAPAKSGAEPPPSLAQYLSPGEKDVIAGIEEKAGKKGFDTKILFAYIAKKDIYLQANVAATMGVFAQMASLNMNTLKPDANTVTKANYAFAATRKAFKQRRLMRWMRQRAFWEKGFILNIEELATIYHFPTIGVVAPATPYIGVKKAGPPTDLPTE